jgi:Carboxypeptidase regulatory-like domain/TonB-dependent Receptor Plug Domain
MGHPRVGAASTGFRFPRPIDAPFHQIAGCSRRICFWMLLSFQAQVWSQTAATGALMGEVLDSAGRGIAHASIEAKNQDMAIDRSGLSDDEGHFVLALLPPGMYRVTAVKGGFSQAQLLSVQVPVTETIRVSIAMRVAGITERIEVQAPVSGLQSDSVALGRVVDDQTIEALPLAARNFTQIVNLSPGVSTGVNNAGELGPGGSGLAQINAGNDGMFVHGSRSYDNSYDFDGVPVTDLQASNIASGGIPIPNPDAISEFKVQTGLYNVSFGEHAGASVSLITKSGTNKIHGDVFEFFRNNFLNANDFFRDLASLPRADLKQNQFGGTIGGPILPDRLNYFGSYQGTRQINGLAADQPRIACAGTVVLPPLTDDRSPQALGSMFGGMRGALGGVAVKPDGANINPVALELLNFKLPDGAYLIPTPQVVNPSLQLASQGTSTISTPCHYNADQVLANLDTHLSQNSSVAVRFLWADSAMNVTFPGNGFFATGNISGFPSDIENRFRVFSVSWVRLMKTNLLNQLLAGYTNTFGSSSAGAPFRWSDLGVSAGTLNDNDGLPSLGIIGSINLTTGFPRNFNQKRFYLSDTLTYSHGRHMIQTGGSLSRIHDDVNVAGIGSAIEFLSWPDFLLGLSAEQNGTLFSNLYGSFDYYGLFNRQYRSWNGSSFLGDHFRLSSQIALDLGLRYESIGPFGDSLGRNSSFDPGKADPNPPASGSQAGYVVAANYAYPLPPGVTRSRDDSATSGFGRNGLAPRIGLAWQPQTATSSVLVRAAYGIYFSQPTGQTFFQSILGAPFSISDQNAGPANAAATFAHPFAEPFPTASFFPYFPSYSPTSDISLTTVSPGFRPGILQQYGLNFQVELARDWVLEVGYVGTRGTHLLRGRALNQALSASPGDPIRGAVSNTVKNIGQRVPVQGFLPDALAEVESEGASWYNGLEASLNKRLSKGFGMLASYTWSKSLDTDGSNTNGISAGNTLPLGDQNSPSQRWGRASFDRTHRFVMSTTYTVPSPSSAGLARALLGGWSASGVLTWQSGTALTISYKNSANVFGISEDRAQLATGCTNSNLVSPGSVESKLNGYFNTSCFAHPPVIGADGIGTAFGDSGTGIVNGPAQFNLDASVVRSVPISWPTESSDLQFRAEFFNALNHPQFSNPNTAFGSSSFGIISGTAVNSRVGQLALKLNF